MAEWIAERRAALDLWQMDMRRFGEQYRSPALHAQAHARGLRDLLRHQVPGPRAPGRAAAARLAALRLARRARRGVRREVRLGAGQLVRVQRGGRRRVAAPARLGRAALVAGDRRRAPRHPRGAPRCSTSPRSPSSRSPARARRRSSSGCATTASRATSGRSPTRRCSTRAAGSSATSPSPGSARTASGSSPAPRSAHHDLAWIALATCRRRSVDVRSTTSPRAGRASRCGARARATSCAAARRTTCSTSRT